MPLFFAALNIHTPTLHHSRGRTEGLDLDFDPFGFGNVGELVGEVVHEGERVSHEHDTERVCASHRRQP